MKGSRKD